jgi:RNA polymerase sigma factor (sigma-70 family)
LEGRKLKVYPGSPPGKTGKKRIGSTQTATWRAVLSEEVITARLFFTFSAVKGAAELHNKSPPDVLHFKKNHEMEDIFMSEWRKIRVQDYYREAVGDAEYTYVTPEVYEILANTFRREAHAEQMRDLRNRTAEGYTEGDTEDLLMESPESLEDMVIRQMEIETLQKAMQTLSEIQRERLHLYFFEGLTYRQIAEKKGIGEKNVRESVASALKKIKNFFD